MGVIKIIDRFWSKVAIREEDECWLWQAAKHEYGYGYFNIGGGMRLAHRVSWELEYGSIPYGKYVLHKCIDTPACVNPYHLYLGDQLDNCSDMRNQGHTLVGEKNSMAKLTNEQVREIKKRLAFESCASLGREYGVSTTCISDIQVGRYWATI